MSTKPLLSKPAGANGSSSPPANARYQTLAEAAEDADARRQRHGRRRRRPSGASSSSTAASSASSSHSEQHSSHGEIIRDTIIGFADGLTVPFALTAGLSSTGSTRLVILGGLAELFSGAISMGLGAYLASITEKKAYEVEEAREYREVAEQPLAEEEEIFEIFDNYGIERERVMPVVEGLKMNPDMWVKFMMDFELKLEKPNTRRAWISAFVMGMSYFVGGLIPMLPYFFVALPTALFVSIAITVVILIVFGYVKAAVSGTDRAGCLFSAVQTLLVGAAAAGTSYAIVRGVDSLKHGDE
ncbi:VIT family-domain-containing protein [Lineolata rhizophorae]|uniref:VIT family-domain-containing protein n=1 Tax=Lineolata rhizophorae TaxID=578093 RepID=A0A6A6P8E5_9PEZI|nr:VIT family-domain-containing protein [Lineolata rhizophorae]